MSGTLGDAFTVFCKLSGYHKRTGNHVRLYRYNQFPGFDDVLSQFFGQIPYIEYIIASVYIESGPYSIEDCASFKGPHISTFWDGDGRGIYPDDPRDMEFDPYPEVYIEPANLKGKNFRVGIQLHSGKVGGNFKGFALRWLAALRRWLPSKEFDVYLFGTGDGYNIKRVRRFCERHNIQNYVGKTNFLEWMGYIKSMDFFITPVGFSAFFAMSQRVRSLVFLRYSRTLFRVPPDWRRENIIMSVGQETLVGRIINRACRNIIGRNRLLRPLKPAQVRSLVDGEIIYR